MTKIINLDKFVPRAYQIPLINALESGKYRRILAIWHRRAGKDIVAFNLMIRAALTKVGVYYYIFGTYSQCRKVIWDSITSSGQKFLDFIPKELVTNTHSTEMKITLLNGSIIQLVGSDNIDSLMGTNPIGVCFSEYALQDPTAYQFIRPILVANGGWSIFISTPRGKNHLFDLYRIAVDNPETWFTSKLTIEDTGIISKEEIDREIKEGLISEDLSLQEYYCSFTMGVEGAYYSKYIDNLRLRTQITNVPWEAAFPVHTAWDIGVRDSTAIIFFQQIGTTVRIIDFYEKSKEGLEHYIKYLDSKPYKYGKHIAPHDIAVREFGSGMTRLEKAKNLGIRFIVADNISIMDGIEAVRSAFSKVYIDQNNCSLLIKALENYRQEWDSKKKVYSPHPLHDNNSHAADAMRYLCVSLSKTSDGMSAKDAQSLKSMAMGGHARVGGDFFNDPMGMQKY
jgi:hypothetical protein